MLHENNTQTRFAEGKVIFYGPVLPPTLVTIPAVVKDDAGLPAVYVPLV
jgi:hypothetical protein